MGCGVFFAFVHEEYQMNRTIDNRETGIYLVYE